MCREIDSTACGEIDNLRVSGVGMRMPPVDGRSRIPLSGITLGLSSGDQFIGLAIVWIAITVINVAYGLGSRPHR